MHYYRSQYRVYWTYVCRAYADAIAVSHSLKRRLEVQEVWGCRVMIQASSTSIIIRICVAAAAAAAAANEEVVSSRKVRPAQMLGHRQHMARRHA